MRKSTVPSTVSLISHTPSIQRGRKASVPPPARPPLDAHPPHVPLQDAQVQHHVPPPDSPTVRTDSD